MVPLRLSLSLALLVLLSWLASASPVPASSSLRRAQQGSWAFNSPTPNDPPPIDIPPIPKGQLPPHGKGPSEGTVNLPAPPKGIPRRKGGYTGPGGHGRRSSEDLRGLLSTARHGSSTRGPAWEGERPGTGNLPPVNLPPFPHPPPTSHVPGNWSGPVPHQGTTTGSGPSKGPPRRKGGYFGPGGHGRRSLEALQNSLHSAFPNLFARANEGAWSYSNPPKSGDLPPINRPPIPNPEPKQGGGNWSGPGPHGGGGSTPGPGKVPPRRKGGYFGPGGHGR